MNDDLPTPENDDEVPENAEAVIFAKIVRYMADQLAEVDPEALPEDLGVMGDLYKEIAEAFEQSGGFEFTPDQALPLSHAFAMLEGGISILADQATGSGHDNAAAKMQWAAIKAKAMTAELETRHLEGAGGIISFDFDLGDDLPPDIDDTNKKSIH